MSTATANSSLPADSGGQTLLLLPPEDCLLLLNETRGFIPWDNPHNLVSQQTEQAVDTAVWALCLPLLFLLSAPTNILNMLVFWKQGLKERINLCLFYLSLVDFLHMLNAMVLTVDRFYLPFNHPVLYGTVYQFLVKFNLTGFRVLLPWLSGFVSMLIACERCFCIVSPLRAHTVLSTKTTAGVLVFFTAFIAVGAFIQSTRWSVTCVFDPRVHTTSLKLLTSRFFLRNRARFNILILFYATIQPCIYVTVVLVTTVVTAVKLRAMTAWREQASSKAVSSQEVALTRMLIAVSVLYVICSSPSTILGICAILMPEITSMGRYSNFGNLFLKLFHLASFINATFNFFIYVSLGSRFRSTLRTFFRGSESSSAPS